MSRDGGFLAVRAAGKKFRDFLTIWWKAPFWLVKNLKKKMGI
jgi:hypothetical protein